MENELIYYKSTHNLQEIMAANPKFYKIYFKSTMEDGKNTITLSKNDGDVLYCVSNCDFPDLKDYLKKNRTRDLQKDVPKDAVPEKRAAQIKPQEPVKKMKQQNLFDLFTKK
jgi:hypothetical protein